MYHCVFFIDFARTTLVQTIIWCFEEKTPITKQIKPHYSLKRWFVFVACFGCLMHGYGPLSCCYIWIDDVIANLFVLARCIIYTTCISCLLSLFSKCRFYLFYIPSNITWGIYWWCILGITLDILVWIWREDDSLLRGTSLFHFIWRCRRKIRLRRSATIHREFCMEIFAPRMFLQSSISLEGLS